ncbi:hypothetical protein CC2G_013764 [Coprinopsis cinerea AmutBmut pab1-1]|nr:hypothetical protein CC2G_013764 [Coprinopsis cinerea AmutBmut pab1-1]
MKFQLVATLLVLASPALSWGVKRDVAQESVAGLTNAERLARGLPLNPPVIRGSKIARQAASPVPVPVAAAAAIPTSTSVNAYIEVRAVEPEQSRIRRNFAGIKSKSIGWVSSTRDEDGVYVSTTKRSERLVVKVDTQELQKGRGYLKSTNTSDPYPYIGGIVPDTREVWDKESNSTALLVGTEKTPRGVGSISVGYSYNTTETLKEEFDAQSALWKLNPTTKELSAVWLNDDGTKHNALISGVEVRTVKSKDSEGDNEVFQLFLLSNLTEKSVLPELKFYFVPV